MRLCFYINNIQASLCNAHHDCCDLKLRRHEVTWKKDDAERGPQEFHIICEVRLIRTQEKSGFFRKSARALERSSARILCVQEGQCASANEDNMSVPQRT